MNDILEFLGVFTAVAASVGAMVGVIGWHRKLVAAETRRDSRFAAFEVAMGKIIVRQDNAEGRINTLEDGRIAQSRDLAHILKTLDEMNKKVEALYLALIKNGIERGKP